MKTVAQLLSWLGLALTLGPACLFFADTLSLDGAKAWMVVGTVVWFAATPVWMKKESSHDTEDG